MTEIHKTTDTDEPWNDPASKKGWYVWQTPWFRRKHPAYYAFFKLMERFGL